MPRLYRSSRDLDHWFVYDGAMGWMTFPARIAGWVDRHPLRALQGLDLHEVPLWLAFHTGLTDAAMRRRPIRRAA
jgi:hypothetical protein